MSWVSTQHRTMAKWVGTKIGLPIEDLTKDLDDGLVLAKLVNVISSEDGSSKYLLTPIHKKPSFRVQKVENVEDILKFCKLILKVNVSTISADNVVDGDLKLILGLIWTLFLYLTSSHIGASRNEGSAMAEIRRILLTWLNSVVKSRALPEITDFSKDWSLQRDSRPDLIFAAVCDYYLPGDLVDYDAFLHGKRLANLDKILALAEANLEIAQLLVAEDFNVLVPDEKCIILYVLQWYEFFELTKDDLVDDTQSEPTATLVAQEKSPLDEFVLLVVEASNSKAKYKVKAVRLIEQVNTNITKLGNLNEEVMTTIALAGLVPLIDAFCADINPRGNVADQLRPRNQFFRISMFLQVFLDILTAYEHFKLVLKPGFVHHDFPEIQAALKTTCVILKKVGAPHYQPEKSVAPSTIATRIECVNELDKLVGGSILATLEGILHKSRLQHFDAILQALKDHLGQIKKEELAPETKKYASEMDQLLTMKAELERLHHSLKPSNSTVDVKTLIDALETLDEPETPDTPDCVDIGGFKAFKEKVDVQKNQSNLTGSDLREFINEVCGPFVSDQAKRDFSCLVPSRRLLNRSESEDFSAYELDSTEETQVFDEVQKVLEEKLLGVYNKLYDLREFVARVEGGFLV